MLTIGKRRALFLLGGHDLEMLTIREILSSQGYDFIDKHLTWSNSKLSCYQGEMARFWKDVPDGIVCGIELENDLAIAAENYLPIDHHNELANRQSALEQVLELLDLPLTRTYRLIAANDRRYIPGMVEAGATDEEVREIRFADRRAQGVTDEDERLAEQSVADHLERRGNLLVVRALGRRFSPICDRLYPYGSLLVYNAAEWTFYGRGAAAVKELLADEIRKGRVYSGGGKDGYVGGKSGQFTESEIENTIEKIKNANL